MRSTGLGDWLSAILNPRTYGGGDVAAGPASGGSWSGRTCMNGAKSPNMVIAPPGVPRPPPRPGAAAAAGAGAAGAGANGAAAAPGAAGAIPGAAGAIPGAAGAAPGAPGAPDGG